MFQYSNQTVSVKIVFTLWYSLKFNDVVPKLVYSIAFLFACFATLLGANLHAQSKPTIYNSLANEVLVLVNEHRAQMKLKPLAMNEIISVAANKHSQNMATGTIEFGHDGFDERMEGLRKKIKQTNSWAENVAYGAKTAKQVVNMWLNSHDHRENIEGNYNQTGLGIVKGRDGNLYYTQIFCKSGK